MANRALITFKAGECHREGKKMVPAAEPGYIYLYEEDELLHFCWRARSAQPSDPALDLIMFPGDATFTPHLRQTRSEDSDKNSPTNGRIFVLKFSSSSQRHFFWMQSKSQHREGTPSWFSERDQHLGEIVNQLLAGEDVDVEGEIAGLRNGGSGEGDDGGDDEAMEDVQGDDTQPEHHQGGSGGAGADATGGDPRQEGEDSRRGGSDGGRAPSDDPSAIVQNFLRSLQGTNTPSQQAQQSYDKPFTTLNELLNTNDTVSFLSSASPKQIDALCAHLPPSIFLLSQESADSMSSAEPTPQAAQAAIEALSTEQKRGLVERVLRSPQLHQSLGSLTIALRDGGLPTIADALGIKVENDGFIKHGSVPLGGGEAVETFLKGFKDGAEQEKKR